MKLASLKDYRDGKLIVVNRAMTRMVEAIDIAPTLQDALDNWSSFSIRLEERYDLLNDEQIYSEPFNPESCVSPLPRAFQWADASAYVNHVELVRRAHGVELPESFWTDPLMYQGGSDNFLAPTEAISLPENQNWGLDFEAEVAVITNDVPLGTSIKSAAQHIKLLMLVNDVSLRALIPDELSKGFGFFQSKPASAFSPVCITPDELGDSWQVTKLHLPLLSFLNDEPFGKPDAGVDMTFNFAELIAHASKTRALTAGSIIGSGTVSNRLDGGPGKPIDQGGVGYSCIAEQRMVEVMENGEPVTPFLKAGDRVRIEMLDKNGNSLFGAIDQQVKPFAPTS
jgi:fumarylacetoacetate (FAA) hydrolase